MKLSSSICLAVLTSAILVTACSSSDSNTPSATAPSTQALIQAVCNQLNKCQPLGVQLEYGDVPTCVSALTNSLVPNDGEPGLAFTDGDLTACANAVTASDCNTSFDDIAVCRFKGSLANGQSCAGSDQCSSAYCQFPDAATEEARQQCGKCAAIAADGAACTEDDGCNVGSECDPTKHVCAPRPAKGAPCTTDGIDCAVGLRCIKSVCADAIADGAACDPADEGACANPTSQCVDNKCTSLDSVITLVAVGATCGLDQTGQKELACKASSCVGAQGEQKCVAFAKEGEACADADSSQFPTAPACTFGLDCDNGKCVKADNSCQ